MPLVLLHGFCEHAILWKKTIPILSKNHCIITFDLPGFGVNIDIEFKSIIEVAQEINKSVSEIIDNKYIVVGHSLGGYIAAEMTHQEPQSKKGISMVHSSFKSDSEQKKENRTKLIKFLQKNNNKSFLQEFKKKLACKERYLELKNDIEEMVFPQNNHAIINASQAMINRKDLSPYLRDIDIPVQYIIGAGDSFWTVNDLIEEASHCKISQINVIQNSCHLAMWEQPKLFNQHLQSFANLCQEISDI